VLLAQAGNGHGEENGAAKVLQNFSKTAVVLCGLFGL
jgi:hypothetical protein